MLKVKPKNVQPDGPIIMMVLQTNSEQKVKRPLTLDY